jgi:hypothetical protein
LHCRILLFRIKAPRKRGATVPARRVALWTSGPPPTSIARTLAHAVERAARGVIEAETDLTRVADSIADSVANVRDDINAIVGQHRTLSSLGELQANAPPVRRADQPAPRTHRPPADRRPPVVERLIPNVWARCPAMTEPSTDVQRPGVGCSSSRYGLSAPTASTLYRARTRRTGCELEFDRTEA